VTLCALRSQISRSVLKTLHTTAFKQALHRARAGDRIPMRLLRGGGAVAVELTLIVGAAGYTIVDIQ
jgi:hypothetical protein